MAGEEIQETECYKYLGVELVGRLDFKKLKERYVARRGRMMLVWAMGMRGGELPAIDCCMMWNALVRPVLEYGAVIWGDVKWEEAERVQRELGKMILRCSSKMANEVVLGVVAESSQRLAEVEVLGEDSVAHVVESSGQTRLLGQSRTL